MVGDRVFEAGLPRRGGEVAVRYWGSRNGSCSATRGASSASLVKVTQVSNGST